MAHSLLYSSSALAVLQFSERSCEIAGRAVIVTSTESRRKKSVPGQQRRETIPIRGQKKSLSRQRPSTLVSNRFPALSACSRIGMVSFSRYVAAIPSIPRLRSPCTKRSPADKRFSFPSGWNDTFLESETLWAKRLRQRYIGDFTSWQDDAAYQQAFTTLLRQRIGRQTSNRVASLSWSTV